MTDTLLEQLRQGAITQARAALALLQPAQLSPCEVHDCRVAIKKLRAIWQLLRPWLNRDLHRQADHNLRDGARALAGARDDHVVATTLEKLARKAKKTERESLERVRHVLFEPVAPSPPPHHHQLAVNALEADLSAWQALAVSPGDHDLLATGLARTYRQCRNRANRALASPDPHAWHDLRKWVKYLLYQQQALALALSPQDRLEALGKRLGKRHDLHVLQEVVENRNTDQAFSRKDRKAALKVIARRESALLKQCGSQSHTLFAKPARKWLRQATG